MDWYVLLEMLPSDPFNDFDKLLFPLIFWILDDIAARQYLVKLIAPFSVFSWYCYVSHA